MENLKIINQNNLINNLMCFKQKKVCAMVKANAYGHGLEKVVEILQGKVDYFGVANVSEAQRARRVTDKPILICSKVQELKTCKKNNFEVIVENEEDLKECLNHGMQDCCHLKINAGMNRFGAKGGLNLRLINSFIEEKQINLKAIHTHFSDTNSFKHTLKEYRNFMKQCAEISQKAPICFGGTGVIKYPFKFDMIRVGIGLYGYGDKRLLPVMKIESYVMKVFYAKRGEFIGYSKNFRVKNAGFFAVIAMGYADGIQRRLSGKFKVLINGRKFESVGFVCMDSFFIEVDQYVKCFDRVCVLVDANEFAKRCKTNTYEILTGFSNMRGETEIV